MRFAVRSLLCSVPGSVNTESAAAFAERWCSVKADPCSVIADPVFALKNPNYIGTNTCPINAIHAGEGVLCFAMRSVFVAVGIRACLCGLSSHGIFAWPVPHKAKVLLKIVARVAYRVTFCTFVERLVR